MQNAFVVTAGQIKYRMTWLSTVMMSRFSHECKMCGFVRDVSKKRIAKEVSYQISSIRFFLFLNSCDKKSKNARINELNCINTI